MKPTANGAILIALLFTLTACSVTKPDTAATQTPVPTRQIQPTVNPTQTEELKPLICIIVPNVDNPYFGSMQEIAAQKAEELGYTALKLTHDDDANKQEEQIDHCIARHAVAILLAHAGEVTSIADIQKASDAGIPTFLIDRGLSQEGFAVSQIVANNSQGATLLAEHFAKLMGKEGRYVELIGRDSDINTQIRSPVFQEVLARFPGMQSVAQINTGWNAENNIWIQLEEFLQTNPNVKGVIAVNDSAAMIAQAVLINAGRTEVIVVGMDGSDDVLEFIMEGGIDATVLLPGFEMATQAAIQADLYIRTGSTGQPEKQYIDMILLTPENACMYTAFAPNGKTSCP